MESLKHRGVALLRWSEKYTKTDMVYLFKNSFWVFFGQVATSLSAFIVMVLLVNYLDKAEYGQYRYVISLILILSLFTLPGLNTALTQSTASGHEGQLNRVVKTKITWGFLGSVVSLLIAAYYWINQDISLAVSFIIVAAFIPFYGTFFVYYYYLQGKQLFSQSALIQSVSRIIFVVVMVAAVFLTQQAVWLIAAYMASTILMQIAGYYWTVKKNKDSEKLDEDLVSYGKYLTLFSATPSTIAVQIGVIATWFYLGDVEAAIYAVAIMLPMEANRFGTILNQISLPKITKQEIDIPALFVKIAKFELVLLFVWVVYAIAAPFIFNVFFPTYPEAVMYSIVAMLMALLVPKVILRGFLLAKKQKKQIKTVSLITPFIQIILTLSLIPLFGIMGAIAATLIAWTIEYLILLYFVGKKNLRKP